MRTGRVLMRTARTPVCTASSAARALSHRQWCRNAEVARRAVSAAAAGKRFPDSLQEELDFASVLEEYEVPTPARIEQKNQRRRFSEFSNETLAVMCSMGVHGAFKERMLREIMRVDRCTYIQAYHVLGAMNQELENGGYFHKFPRVPPASMRAPVPPASQDARAPGRYQTGIAAAWGVGLVLIPLGVFHQDTAIYFATEFVRADVPSAEEIDTVWKVGSWTWQWMEPIIGTWSFMLLSLQLIRTNMNIIDAKPFNEHFITRRADNLHKHFPQYEREIVRDYSKSDPFGRDSFRVRQGYPANSVIPVNRFRQQN